MIYHGALLLSSNVRKESRICTEILNSVYPCRLRWIIRFASMLVVAPVETKCD